MKIWIDMTAPAHPVVFRPLIRRLREAGHEVEVTARDYAQTLALLELHGMDHIAFGHHGGASRLGKFGQLLSRARAMRKFGRKKGFDLALAHGSNDLAIVARACARSFANKYASARFAINPAFSFSICVARCA